MFEELKGISHKVLDMYYNTVDGQKCMFLNTPFKSDLNLFDCINEAYVYENKVVFICNDVLKFYREVKLLSEDEILNIYDTDLFLLYSINSNGSYTNLIYFAPIQKVCINRYEKQQKHFFDMISGVLKNYV